MRPLRIAIAPDSFKGSMTAQTAARRLESGFRRVFPEAEILRIPMADGGEGTAAILVEAASGRWVESATVDPLGRPITAGFGLSGDGKEAFVEVAAASGLTLLEAASRDPARTSTCGTGILIRKALDCGPGRLLIGLGGSATNDGGCGMAEALGTRFLDATGEAFSPTGGNLDRLERIDLSGLDPRLGAVEIEAVCDVTIPLCGPTGTSALFAPQKGASPELVARLDRNLAHLAAIMSRDLGREVAGIPGAGAAGGLGAGLLGFLGARLRPGVETVMERLRFRERIAGCDLVITGEGRFDGQSLLGKVVSGVAAAARTEGIALIVLCGSLGEGLERIHDHGVAAFLATSGPDREESELRRHGPERLENLAEECARLLRLGAARLDR
ncbi:MAG: glycerate kinase [Magnetococcales bacterium]|nr:glycerate kinase [Magnetococcales bacterium]